MLASDMVEKSKNMITIEVTKITWITWISQDACPDVVQQMVRYMYTAKVRFDDDLVLNPVLR